MKKRKPENVEKLIADAKTRQVESAVVRYAKIIRRVISQQNSNGGGGTRGERR